MVFGVGAGVGTGSSGGSGFMVGNEHTIFCSGRGGTRDGLLVSSTNPLASLSVL